MKKGGGLKGEMYTQTVQGGGGPHFKKKICPRFLFYRDHTRSLGSRAFYMIHDRLWERAGMAPKGGYLCIGCLEKRLGRRLRPADFTAAPLNDPSPWDTPRLAATRRGRK